MYGWTVLLLLFLPTAAVVLIVGILGFSAAFVVARRRPAPFLSLSRGLAVAIIIWDIVAAAGAWSSDNNLVHMFWTVHVPVLALFLMSGPFLASTWTVHDFEEVDVEGGVARRLRGAWPFYALNVVLAVLPLILMGLRTPSTFWTRQSDSPTHDVVQIFLWGLGGELPTVLVPFAQEGIARGVGFPSRDVSVALLMLLTVSWTSIGFTLIAFATRFTTSRRGRFLLCQTLPPLLGVVTWFVHEPLGVWDPRLFGPFSAHDSDVWNGDVASLRSLGGVLLTAVLGCAAVGGTRWIDARRVSPRLERER